MADPLVPYPFPSNVHVLSSVTLKLNDSNCLLWKTHFESLLSSQKILGFVNGGVGVPAQTRPVVRGDVTVQEPNPQYEAWFCTDQLVRSWIFGKLSEEVLGSVRCNRLAMSDYRWPRTSTKFPCSVSSLYVAVSNSSQRKIRRCLSTIGSSRRYVTH